MEVVYHVKRAYASEFSNLLFALNAYTTRITYDSKNLPVAYQRLTVPEEVLYLIATHLNVDYWDNIILPVLAACLNARNNPATNDVYSGVQYLPLYIVANKEILDEEIPDATTFAEITTAALPIKTEPELLWKDSAAVVVKELDDDRVIIRPYINEYLTEGQLLTLFAYRAVSPHNITFVTHETMLTL
jgi:hypothetical protein